MRSNHRLLGALVALLVLGVPACSAALQPSASSSSTNQPPNGDRFQKPFIFDAELQYPTTKDAESAGAPERGQCVLNPGVGSESELRIVDCADPAAIMRIVQVARMPRECVADVDYRYFSGGGTSNWTACMDINWRKNECVLIDSNGPAPAPCASRAGLVRADGYVSGGTEIGLCPHRSGMAHPTRKFIVCTESL